MSLCQEAVEYYIQEFLTYFIFAFSLFKYDDAEEMYFMKLSLIYFILAFNDFKYHSDREKKVGLKKNLLLKLCVLAWVWNGCSWLN